MKVSIVIPLRITDGYPRDLSQFKLCLQSLRNQTVSRELIEIIIGDFGSEEKYLSEIKEFCKNFEIKFIHEKTIATWSRSRALNIAVRNSNPESRFIFINDMEIILRKNCIEKVLQSVSSKRVVVCEIRDLPANYIPADFRSGDFGGLGLHKSVPRPLGFGICCFPREWIFKIRGYDEEFKGWGGEDDDLIKRARLNGMLIVRLYNLAFHLWHKSLFDAKEIIPFREANRKRLKELNTLIRNTDREWGQIQE